MTTNLAVMRVVVTSTPVVEKTWRRNIFLWARYDVLDGQFYIWWYIEKVEGSGVMPVVQITDMIFRCEWPAAVYGVAASGRRCSVDCSTGFPEEETSKMVFRPKQWIEVITIRFRRQVRRL